MWIQSQEDKILWTHLYPRGHTTSAVEKAVIYYNNNSSYLYTIYKVTAELMLSCVANTKITNILRATTTKIPLLPCEQGHVNMFESHLGPCVDLSIDLCSPLATGEYLLTILRRGGDTMHIRETVIPYTEKIICHVPKKLRHYAHKD